MRYRVLKKDERQAWHLAPEDIEKITGKSDRHCRNYREAIQSETPDAIVKIGRSLHVDADVFRSYCLKQNVELADPAKLETAYSAQVRAALMLLRGAEFPSEQRPPNAAPADTLDDIEAAMAGGVPDDYLERLLSGAYSAFVEARALGNMDRASKAAGICERLDKAIVDKTTRLKELVSLDAVHELFAGWSSAVKNEMEQLPVALTRKLNLDVDNAQSAEQTVKLANERLVGQVTEWRRKMEELGEELTTDSTD